LSANIKSTVTTYPMIATVQSCDLEVMGIKLG